MKYKKEIQNFGNNGWAFVIPEWEVDDVSFTFNEDTNFSISKLLSHAMQYLFDFSDDKWYYKENNIYEILVDVYDNNFNKIIYRYTYRYLKLVKYENYQLDYSNDALTSLSLTFSFMYANEQACDIDPNSSNVPDITDTTQNAAPATSLSQDIAQDYNKPAMKPEDANSNKQQDRSNQQTSEQAAAKTLEFQKTKMEQDSKTEQVQTPAADKQETNNDKDIVLDNVESQKSESKQTPKTEQVQTPAADKQETNNDKDIVLDNVESQKSESKQTPKTEQVQTPAVKAPESDDQQIVLDNVNNKANEGAGAKKTKETAATNPVDLSKLSGNDRIDELAYRMMRGQLDNGKLRYDKTYKAGYTESERAAAQSIVNQKDWEGLKKRHDARVANKDTHYSTAAETEVAKTDYTPNKDIAQSRSADIVSPASQSTGGQSAADAAAKARLAAEQRNKSQDVAVNTKPVEKKQEAQPKQETTKVAHPEPQKSEEKKQPKQEATQVAKASPKISEEKLEKAGISKANKNERKYRGLTSTQWGEIAARKDLQDGLRKDGKGANYDILYANGDIDKTKFDSGYKSYMEKNKKPT
ncbi:MAG: hypothetical protein ACI4OP_03025 [Candidatus Coprovivens sp.]